MRSRECHGLPPIPRRTFAVRCFLVLALVAFGAPISGQSILPPDAAVKAYQAGQAAAQRRDWPQVIRRMNDALATGHTQARTHFGTTRNFVDLYDPYYWLGVAHMELGEVLEAKHDLLKSRSEGVIDGFPESADLLGRLGALERREALQAAALATPTPATASPPSLPIEPTAAPTPATFPAPAPTASGAREDLPPGSRETASVDPERVLTLFAAGDFGGAEAAVETLRLTRPDAREADLLATLVLGTRYVLEGSADASLLARARKSLASFRRRGGARRSEEALLSPSLLATLNRNERDRNERDRN